MATKTGASDIPSNNDMDVAHDAPVAPAHEAMTQPAVESLVITGTELPLPRLSRLPLEVSTADANESGLDRVDHTDARLPNIDPASIALWRALHAIRPRSLTYAADFASETALDAATALCKTLNIDAVKLPEDVEGKWYGVMFRSKRKEQSESINLYEADRQAHEEAVTHGGLLFYWYGVPDILTGFNMATCIWTDPASARVASDLPKHNIAKEHARLAYATFDLSRYAVIKVKGELGVRVEPWA